MKRDAYWALIDQTRKASDGDLFAQEDLLRAAIEAMPVDEIVAFERHSSALLTGSYSTHLWGAAYLINGGSSDDGFDYFRGWLISQGRAVYDAALASPDTLADVPGIEEGDFEFEALWYLARQAYEKKAGAEMPDDQGGDEEEEDAQDATSDDEFEGDDFDDEDLMRRRYPRLAELFLAD